MVFSWPLRVYIEDTDYGGIVYYVNYLKFMERARTELLRSLGISQQQLAVQQRLFVVHKVDCQYKRPALLDDELIVETALKEQAAARVVFQQKIIRARDSVVLCQAEVQVACVNSTSMKPCRWPSAISAGLEKYCQCHSEGEKSAR
ncbi:tol-pal system-associated acyl-CoA thioesterase [Nitrincola sp. MINF-07-Sa-05]|uniref:tol-pal system-associated acyl-CoA thioesterase n=1 Tax=Nitrincola salilacus TaxID=3400273 RepID=UPI0039182BEF